MQKIRRVNYIIVYGLAALLFACHWSAEASEVRVEVLVPGSVMQAVEGIDYGPDGMIYGTSIHAQAVYRINPVTGLVSIAIAAPYGESDDVAIGPEGSPVEGVLAWTAQRTGEIRIQRPGGMPQVLMGNAPRVNPIAFTPDGRLFTAQVGAGENSIWELDVIGNNPPRLVAKNQGAVNGFGFGPDGYLYAPHFGTDELFAIDVDKGAFRVVAEGVGSSAAAKVDANGDVWSVDYKTGDVWLTEIKTNKSRIIATFPPPLDNLTIGKDGTIYLANLAVSGIIGFKPETGESWDVTVGFFTVPLGMTITTFEGREAILVADPFGYRFLDPKTGAITRQPEMWSSGASSSVAANDQYIVTTYTDSKRIKKIDRETGKVLVNSTALSTPRGIVITNDGEVIIADSAGNRLVRLVGENVEEVAVGLNEPVDILLETDATVLVTEVESGTISRVNLSSGGREELVAGLHDPRGLARLPDGRLVVVEPGLGMLTAFDLVTGQKTELIRGLPVSIDRLDLPTNTPIGISVDSSGAIYVSCGADNSILRVSLGL